MVNMANLHMGLKIFAKNNPNDVAINFYDKSLTFQQLYQRVNALANSLLDLGVRKGDHIAVYMRNRVEMPEIFYAISSVGAVCVPINYMVVGDGLVQLLNSSDSKYIFLEPDLQPQFEQVKGQLRIIHDDTTIMLGSQSSGNYVFYEKLLKNGSQDDPGIMVTSQDTAAIIYSSGTTSLPKGIVFTQDILINRVLHAAVEWKMNYSAVSLISIPMYHNAGYLNTLFLSVFGCKLIIMKEFNPEQVLQFISQHKVSHALMVPTQYHYLLQVPTLEQYDLSSLELLVSSASPLSEAHKRRIVEVFKCNLSEYYGCTETFVITGLRPEEIMNRSASVGKNLEWAEIRLVDDDGNDVGVGEDGEFVSRGPTSFCNYYNLPEETEKSFFPGGWFRTGDMGKMDEEGYYYLLDRKKDMIISGGVNIYPKDIEETMQTHPAVFDVAVIGVSDEVWGESVKAYVVLKPEQQSSEQELIEYCNAKLAKFQRIKHLEFLAALPRNPSGKVLKRELRLR